jgi:hypothetical protein
MRKIKIKLNGNEMKAVMFILRMADKYGERGLLTGIASMDSLEKLFMKLITRMKNFKAGNNTLLLTLQEAWALNYQVNYIGNRLEAYEYNVWLQISQEIHKRIDHVKLNSV